MSELPTRPALDCGDHSCLFATDRGGMRTNGGCRCLDALEPRQAKMLRRMWHTLKAERDAAMKTALAVEAERESEWKRANHWMAVALAFRDATTEAAVEARDGERDPYLERAQDLYNATARDFGPVAVYNRFFCDCCDGTVYVDEDGLCTMCGGDTWGVFEPVR